jgi:hypothetical protein
MTNLKLLAIVLSLGAVAPAFAQRSVNPTTTPPAAMAAVAAPKMAMPPMHVAMASDTADTAMPHRLTAEEYAPNLFVGM